MQLASENDENTSISSMDSLDILEEVVDCQPSFEVSFEHYYSALNFQFLLSFRVIIEAWLFIWLVRIRLGI